MNQLQTKEFLGWLTLTPGVEAGSPRHKIEGVVVNNAHPRWDVKHADEARAVQEVTKLFDAAH